MNIEKLKNYNQKLLAVFGTIAVIFAVGALIFIGYAAIDELRPSPYNYPNGLIAEDQAQKFLKESHKKQLISYESPKLLDSLKSIYFIPVSQTGLVSMLKEEAEMNSILNRTSASYHYESARHFGDYNNILIYDSQKDSSHILFEDRLNFNVINQIYVEDDILLSLKAANTDTDSSGIMDMQDLLHLYVYSLETKQMRVVGQKNSTVLNYAIINESKDLIIQFGKDYNEDGNYDSQEEPSYVMRYYYKTRQLVPVITENLSLKLQQQLQGE